MGSFKLFLISVIAFALCLASITPANCMVVALIGGVSYFMAGVSFVHATAAVRL